MVMRVVGECIIETGAASTLTIGAADVSDLYSIEFAVKVGTPLAGTTAVTAIPKNGTSETVTDGFVQKDTRPAGAEDHIHHASGGGDGVEVYQCDAQGFAQQEVLREPAP